MCACLQLDRAYTGMRVHATVGNQSVRCIHQGGAQNLHMRMGMLHVTADTQTVRCMQGKKHPVRYAERQLQAEPAHLTKKFQVQRRPCRRTYPTCQAYAADPGRVYRHILIADCTEFLWLLLLLLLLLLMPLQRRRMVRLAGSHLDAGGCRLLHLLLSYNRRIWR